MKNEHLVLPAIVHQIVLAMKTEFAHALAKKDFACVAQTVIVANNHFLFILFVDKLI
jgi:hypothetical protein